MAKKPTKSDRRAVIDELRKKQRSAERTRGLVIIAVCVVIALVIVGAAAARPVIGALRMSKYNSEVLADVGKSPSAAGCQKTVTLSTSTKNLPTGGTYYTTAPPAFGPSATAIASTTGAPMATKYYTAKNRPDLATLVRNLSEGYTILWYDDTVGGSELDQIRAIAKKFTGTTDFRDKFIAAPWTAADAKATAQKGKVVHTTFPAGTHIAFSHWSGSAQSQTSATTQSTPQQGFIQYCREVSGAALKQFMLAHPYTSSPDPTTA